jgi:hypothetical protein
MSKIPDVPPFPVLPPPAWAPALQHAPLSADPTLRALSTGAIATRPALVLSNSSPDLLVQPLNIHKRKASAPLRSMSNTEPAAHTGLGLEMIPSPRKQTPLSMPDKPPPPLPIQSMMDGASRLLPAVPARAPGRSIHAQERVGNARPATSSEPHKIPVADRLPLVSVHSSPSRTNLRRPDPVRYRHYHQVPSSHTHTASRYLPVKPAQLQSLQQHQQQRDWRRNVQASNHSVYSTSSYVTEIPTSTTRGY